MAANPEQYEKKRLYNIEYRKKNKEKIRKQNLERYYKEKEENPERIKARRNRYVNNNRDKVRKRNLKNYHDNRDHYLEQKRKYAKDNKKEISERRKENVKRNVEFVNNTYKNGTPCSDCKKSFPNYVMDFHHLPGTKKRGTISHMVLHGWPLKTIISEIKKCILVCANCHRIRHHEEQTDGGKA